LTDGELALPQRANLLSGISKPGRLISGTSCRAAIAAEPNDFMRADGQLVDLIEANSACGFWLSY